MAEGNPEWRKGLGPARVRSNKSASYKPRSCALHPGQRFWIFLAEIMVNGGVAAERFLGNFERFCGIAALPARCINGST